MIIAPRRIRPLQVFQVFASILHMKKYQEYVHVHVSIIRDDEEYAGTVLRFDRPSSRIMQLRVGLLFYVLVYLHLGQVFVNIRSIVIS